MSSEESPKEVAETCGARAEFGRTSCSLEKGHVRSEDDWHMSKIASKTTEQQGLRYTIVHESSEIVRWAPASYEIPRQPKAEPED